MDDTRKTLQYCVEELIKVNKPAAVAVAVVHNKVKKKLGKIPDGVAYFAGEEIPDIWTNYPWDASAENHDIFEHERIARECQQGGELAQKSSRQLILAMVISALVISALSIAVGLKMNLISKN